MSAILFHSAKRYFVLVAIIVVLSGMQSTRVFAVDQVELYNVWETQVTNYSSYSNPFDFRKIELQATFTSPSGRYVNFFGFYDGDGSGGQAGNIWKLRFMPDKVGTWTYTYTWSDGTLGGSGDFSVIQSNNIKNHGHVHVDSDYPKYLIHDDGTFHYWWGATWINAKAYGPQHIEGVINEKHLTDEIFITLLDTLEKYKHNGLLIKIALFPLKEDKYTWNLKWIHRAEWLVIEMQKRGIYCQINFFDTWSREKNSLDNNTDGKQQVFNVWEPGDEGAKKNYIKTIVSRFAGFSNVYWELGNEMEHSPNSGTDFVEQANSKYISWIRQYDPYVLPIGLSEGCWRTADVDIGFLHQPNTLFTSPSEDTWDRPIIMNELVFGGITGPLWKDSTIRHDDNRVVYRKTFWLMFTLGGSGSSNATSLDFNTPLNQAVKNVMNDQMYLRYFIESLPVNINAMIPDSSFVISGPGTYKTRCKTGITYVSYFYLSANEAVQKGSVKVNLPKGNYRIEWFDPRHGTYTPKKMVRSEGWVVSIEHPEFFEDIVLLVRNDSL